MKLGRLLGLFEKRPEREDMAISEGEIQKLIDERAAAREAKDFVRGDAIREELAGKGITLEDKPGDTIWRRS